MTQLRISEIFYSLQGESTLVGLPSVFIRLTGCPLRCAYCDTSYAFKGGESMEVAQILTKIATFQCQTICVTGGEPLAQKNCLPFLKQLCDLGYQVSLETSGALDIRAVDPRVIKVMDLKTPASGEESKNKMENLAFLDQKDQIKIVIANETDYIWAKQQIKQYKLTDYCTVLFSPCQDELSATTLANWILADKLVVRFQFQLHKMLWGNVAGK